MSGAGANKPAIDAFRRSYQVFMESETDSFIRESDVTPVNDIQKYEELTIAHSPSRLLQQVAVCKLNGGLGTGMGLNKAKSLLPVKDGLTFLDIIARQMLALRDKIKIQVPLYFMNSRSTSADTLAFLQKYPALPVDNRIEFLQSWIPKIDLSTQQPVEWPDKPELEWCPPGHGDLYPSLAGSGLLDSLLSRGVIYLFISNADNLGATLDPVILSYFSRSGFDFLMEVAERTEADKKGGHLVQVKESGRLCLRESAQSAPDDIVYCQDVNRHRYFNTNNLWLNLVSLKKTLQEHSGAVPLPVIRNQKHVDPTRPDSPRVVQLETAMGSAIESFARTSAVVVDRSRFLPVKNTSDLIVLRSDAYQFTKDFHVELADAEKIAPVVQLDDHFKMMHDFDHRVQVVPSLKDCQSLKVKGPVSFQGPVTIRGSVEINAQKPIELSGNVYDDKLVTF